MRKWKRNGSLQEGKGIILTQKRNAIKETERRKMSEEPKKKED